jgi:hypothetical protein
MSKINRSIIHACAVFAIAASMLTLVPAATSSIGNAPQPGGFSVIHKNGDTPVWMAEALRAADGVWI